MSWLVWIGAGAAAVAVFMAGFTLADAQWQAKATRFQLELERQSAQSTAQAQEIERSWQERLTQEQKGFAEQKAELEKRYHDLLQRSAADSVRTEQSTTSNAQVSTSPGAPARVGTTCPARPHGPDRAALERVRAELLAVAKDCDVLAARYNALLNFYKEARARQIKEQP